MSTASYVNDQQELAHVKNMVINRLLHMPRCVRVVLEDLADVNHGDKDLMVTIEYVLEKDKYYQKMIRRNSCHAQRQAERRYRMTVTAVFELFDAGKIFTNKRVVNLNMEVSNPRIPQSSSKRRIKIDNRSYHGRPRRDRRRLPQAIAA